MASYRTAPWFQGVLLGGFCLVASVTLALGYRLSAPAIEARQKEDMAASLEQVIPASYRSNDMVADAVVLDGPAGKTTVYRARKGGTVTAVAYRVVGQGYGGELVIVMGVDRDGEILGVRVVQHSETPGLGDKVDVRKTRWVDAFSGKSLANTPDAKWAVKKDGGQFDQFSGATITPRGVIKAVKEGLAFFAAHRARMLDESAGAAEPSRAAPGPAPTPRSVS
ncbi:MAG: electron transport complex subunit RsxG [Rhodospirillaceae bacterium]